MNQINADRHSLDQKSTNDSKGNGFPKRTRKVFYGEFWQNNPWSYWAGIIGAIFVAPAVNYPGLTRHDLWFIFCGFSIWLLTCIIWYVDGKRRLAIPTEEEINEEFRQSTDESLGKLHSNVVSLASRLEKAESRFDAIEQRVAGRSMTSQQIEFTASYLKSKNAVFGVCISYSRFARDGSQLATSFGEALKKAGWNLSEIGFTAHEQFDLEFLIHPDDHHNIPEPVQHLVAALAAQGIMTLKTKFSPSSELPKGVLGIYVGTAP